VAKKIIIILSAVFAAAILFWIAAQPWINSANKFKNIDQWLFPLICMVMLSALVCLALIAFQQKLPRNLVFAIVSLPSFIVFGLNQYLLAVSAVIFLFFRLAIGRIDAEKSGRLKISPYDIAKKGLYPIIISLLIAISFAYYLTPPVQKTVSKKELPPSIGNFINRAVNGVLESDKIENIPENLKDSVRSDFMDEFNGFLKNTFGDYYKFLPPILAFGLFLILFGLNYLFIWPAIGLCVLLFKLFRKIGLIKIEEYETRAERIVI